MQKRLSMTKLLANNVRIPTVARSNRVFKEAYNACLILIAEQGAGGELPSEPILAGALSASRTTVRAVLRRLHETSIIHWRARQKTILRAPADADYFTRQETRSTQQIMEPVFMEYILGGGLQPGSFLHESELAREFSVSVSTVREYMIRFSRFGLIEKKPNRHWVLKGFTREFAMELCDIRELYELSALSAAENAIDDPEFSRKLDQLEREHRMLIDDIDGQHHNFPRLDDRFHRLIESKRGNRFVSDFSDLISLIFHYHYRWDKSDEKLRHATAAREHLRVIEALQARQLSAARARLTEHLRTARRTLSNAVLWDEGSERAA